jgi:hypothetical protein
VIFGGEDLPVPRKLPILLEEDSSSPSAAGEVHEARSGGNRSRNGSKTFLSLERPQKINDFLLLLRSQLIEMFDDLIGLAAKTLVRPDGVH